MKNLVISLFLCIVICFANGCKSFKSNSQPKSPIIVGYILSFNWSNPGDVTYLGAPDVINLFHLWPTDEGKWQVTPNMVERINKIRDFLRPEQEVFVVVGGGGFPSTPTHLMGNDPVLREAYADSLVRFAHENNFDGIDMDWETNWGASPVQRVPHDGYLDLMTRIRTKMNALPSNTRLKKLSSALDGNQKESRELAASVDHLVDIFNVMVYDAYGTEEEGYPHAPMRMFTAALEGFAEAGIPKNKIMGGVPFYGSDRSIRPARGGNYRRLYNEALEAGTPLTPDMDKYNGVAFNGVNTIKEKTEFVLKNGYGGLQIWELTHDIPYNNEMSLLRTMRKTIDDAK